MPVDRRVILRRGRVIGRGHRLQVDLVAGPGLRFGGIHQAVAAHPDRIIGLRQIRQHIAAGIVGDHDLGIFGGQILGFGDHPDAGFRAMRPRDRAADVIGVDRHLGGLGGAAMP